MGIKVRADIADSKGEKVAILEFTTYHAVTGAVTETLHRLTHEMDYSTVYWKTINITLTQED